MKLYDTVRLIADKKMYNECGIYKGALGVIMDGPRNGHWLVYFKGEIKQYEDGCYYTTEEDVSVDESDLEVVLN